MKADLIFPPFFISYQPYSSLPALGAIIRQHNHEVDLLDENILFINDKLNPSYMAMIYEDISRIRRELKDKPDDTPREKLLSAYITGCFKDAYFALMEKELVSSIDILRDRELIKVRRKAGKARDVVNKAQNLLSQYIRFYQIYRCPPQTREYELTWENIKTELKNDTIYRRFFNTVTLPKIIRIKPGLIGISAVFEEQIIPSLILADEIKQTPGLEHVHITIGGPAVTILKEVIQKQPEFFSFVDTCVVHEGEQSLIRLMETLNAGGEFDHIPNLIYKKDNTVFANRVETGLAPDTLPTPLYEGLNPGHYFSPNIVPTLKTTRGCYWNKCTFCNNAFLNNYSRVRSKSPENIFKDFVTLFERHGLTVFSLWEEAAVPKVLKKLALHISESGYDFKWFTEARLDGAFTGDMLEGLYRGGCRGMVFGLESGSPRVQGMMNKGYALSTCKDVIRACSKARIRVYLTLMVGFPSETIQEALETIRFVSENARYIYHAGVSHFGLRKYTPIYYHPENFDMVTLNHFDLFSSIGDLGFKYNGSSGMKLEDSMQLYRVITDELVKLGLNRNEPESHFLIQCEREN